MKKILKATKKATVKSLSEFHTVFLLWSLQLDILKTLSRVSNKYTQKISA